MVLWELTLATAYVLGLKRTYRLVLRLQRRLITHRRPHLRQFVHRRTRTVFDIVQGVHRNVQDTDIEMGRSLGNWILRWLDRTKPAANIRQNTLTKLLTHEERMPTESVGLRRFIGVSSIDGKYSTAKTDSGRGMFARIIPVPKACRGLLASIPEARSNDAFVRFNAAVFQRSLPSMAVRLWCQPIRHNIGAIGMFRHISYATSQPPICWQTSRFNIKSVLGGFINKDITVWMQQ